jgi:hypothetical protein
MTTTTTGQELKEAGMARVRASTSPEWTAAFEQEAAAELMERGSFTAEEVVAVVGQPHHPNAIGAACRAFAQRNDLCYQYEAAKSPSAHGRVIKRWMQKGGW